MTCLFLWDVHFMSLWVLLDACTGHYYGHFIFLLCFLAMDKTSATHVIAQWCYITAVPSLYQELLIPTAVSIESIEHNPWSWDTQLGLTFRWDVYRKIYNISRTNSLNSNVSCLGLQLSCAIYWSQVMGGEWRCSWSSADRRCSKYIWVIVNFIANFIASYIRDLTVLFKNWGSFHQWCLLAIQIRRQLQLVIQSLAITSHLILLMPREHYCHGMCKIWQRSICLNRGQRNVHRIWIAMESR